MEEEPIPISSIECFIETGIEKLMIFKLKSTSGVLSIFSKKPDIFLVELNEFRGKTQLQALIQEVFPVHIVDDPFFKEAITKLEPQVHFQIVSASEDPSPPRVHIVSDEPKFLNPRIAVISEKDLRFYTFDISVWRDLSAMETPENDKNATPEQKAKDEEILKVHIYSIIIFRKETSELNWYQKILLLKIKNYKEA